MRGICPSATMLCSDNSRMPHVAQLKLRICAWLAALVHGRTATVFRDSCSKYCRGTDVHTWQAMHP